MRIPEKKYLMIGGIAAIVCVVALVWSLNRPKPVLVAPSSRSDCKRQLETLRLELRQAAAKEGKPPRYMFDPRTTAGYPHECVCPQTHCLYVYDPKAYPDKWVVCPDHSGN